MDSELIRMLVTGVAGTLGGGGGAFLAIRVHIDHIRERLNRHHDNHGQLFGRVSDHDRRLATLEARQ